MKNSLVVVSVSLLLLTVVTFSVHYLIFTSFFADIETFYPLIAIYVFLFGITFLVYLALYFLSKYMKDYVGMGFLVGIVVKMLATFVLFIPLINNTEYNYLTEILNFFAPYFIFLIFETVVAVKLINSK